ncbi:uncharacterized protein LOC128891264 [Hylaeus anthracinus]|uniref:uncharacterized protein LOC128880414 n=1 Tax=Hylaeus volcanicus TaxID=313075 RepID=UPI0023B79021|nr:uncharacterized protein LOC128880414 [Hylaeus volcanicus]XP_054006651.1 uncharacterized protein LOC128891264 [Hylaeus anthracinus]
MNSPSISEKYMKEETSASRIKGSLEDSLCMLSEELDALGIEPVTLNISNEPPSLQTLLDVSLKLVDASWKLIHKHRSQMKRYDQLEDVCSKISNDNYNLKNRVKASKEALERQERTLSQTLERERCAKEEIQKLKRQHKSLLEETIKLGKLLRSKQNQYEHQLRCMTRSRDKYLDQLEKLMGNRRPKGERMARPDLDEEQSSSYEEIILRLVENNRAMLQKINEQREELMLCSSKADAGVE